jgi:hypothetical protein
MAFRTMISTAGALLLRESHVADLPNVRPAAVGTAIMALDQERLVLV